MYYLTISEGQKVKSSVEGCGQSVGWAGGDFSKLTPMFVGQRVPVPPLGSGHCSWLPPEWEVKDHDVNGQEAASFVAQLL
jgi:hypothetical protein